MLIFEKDEKAGLIEFTVDGAIARSEFDATVAATEDMLTRHEKLNAIGIVHGFDGMDLSVWWADLNWGVRHWNRFGRMAVVTDIGWIAQASKLSAFVSPAQVRVFPVAELEAARAWVKGVPTE